MSVFVSAKSHVLRAFVIVLIFALLCCDELLWRDKSVLAKADHVHRKMSTYAGLVLALCSANERWCYFVMTSLIGWAQTYNQSWYVIPVFSVAQVCGHCYIVLTEQCVCLVKTSLIYWGWGKMAAVSQATFSNGQATSHYLNQWWWVYWRIYASLGLSELTHHCYIVIHITDAGSSYTISRWYLPYVKDAFRKSYVKFCVIITIELHNIFQVCYMYSKQKCAHFCSEWGILGY